MIASKEEPVIKKARMIDNVKNNSVVDVNYGNGKDTEEKETCVASADGSHFASDEKKIEQVVALSLADRMYIPDKEMEEKEVDVVGDANTENVLDLENKIEPYVTSRDEISLTENRDSCAIDKDNESHPPIPVTGNMSSCAIDKESGSHQPFPGKKLLVLDLNGLLADIVNPVAHCKADINIGRRAIFKRPFCDDFLKFCFHKFEVGIWSSRKQTNVEKITEFLLGNMKSKLLFCWDMSYCATTTVGSLENRHKFVVFKDLNKLWEKHDSKLPWEKGYYNETNTVLLDDSPYKALLNPAYTAIFPYSYNHLDKTDTSLGNNGDLRLYLEKLVEAENVQDFIKKNPFGQEAITEASESWEFYRQAIRMNTITE